MLSNFIVKARLQRVFRKKSASLAKSCDPHFFNIARHSFALNLPPQLAKNPRFAPTIDYQLCR